MLPSFPFGCRSFLLPVAVSALAFCLSESRGVAAAESGPLPLKVRFWADEIELTGAMPDERSADRLRIAVYQAQAGKAVWDRLVIDPGRAPIELPRLDDIAGLLLELSLSTIDGSLEITSERLVITGLTDSQVTHAAMEARLRMLGSRYGSRSVLNRICIVTEDDLALPQPVRPRPSLNPVPLDRAPFVLADSEYGPMPPVLVAMPVSVAAEAPADAAVMAATPVEQEETPPGHAALDPIQFAVNTYLVRSDQFARIDEALKQIRALPESAGKIVLRGYPDQPGRYDYNDWLGKSRAQAVLRQFRDAGVPETRLSVEVPKAPKDGPNLGKVLILVPQPASVTPATAGTLTGNQPDAAIGTSVSLSPEPM